MEDRDKGTPRFDEEVSSKVLEASDDILEELLNFFCVAVDILLPLKALQDASFLSKSPLLQGLVEPQV